MQARTVFSAAGLALALALGAASPSSAGERQIFRDLGSVNDAANRVSMNKEASDALLNGTVLAVQPRLLAKLRAEAPESLQVGVPFEGRTIQLDLAKANLFAPGFRVTDDRGRTIKVDLGLHYSGRVAGEPGSWAALSLFDGQVSGMIASTSDGNVVVGQLEGDARNRHIAYADRSFTKRPVFSCATDHSSAAAQLPADLTAPGIFDAAPAGIPNKSTSTVGIAVHVARSLYNAKGGSAGVTRYVNTIFNLSRTLYANESIPVAMSQLVLNAAGDGYGTNPSTNLSRFQSLRSGSFVGQLAQLVGYGTQGGIAAGFAGFCAANRRNSMCTSQIDGTSAALPTWSYSVEVFTHELGHLMGSRHTHACVWNGNNTAIDGCSGFVEGNCALPNVPASQGTIMSYCQGFSFNRGFGSQPGNVIRSRYAAAG
jgi:hypothetical protein